LSLAWADLKSECTIRFLFLSDVSAFSWLQSVIRQLAVENGKWKGRKGGTAREMLMAAWPVGLEAFGECESIMDPSSSVGHGG